MKGFKPRGGQRRALFLATLGFFAGFAAVSAYGPIVPLIKQAMSLGPLTAGLLAAVPALTGSLLRIPFGAMVDRAGGKRPILILLALSMAGLGLIAILFSLNPAPSASMLWPFAAAGMLAGCGIATFSVGIATVSYWFPQRSQGTALAIYGGLGNAAPGLFAMILPLLVSLLGLTASYSIWLMGLAAFVVAFAFLMHDAPSFQLKANGYHVDHEDAGHREMILNLFGQELLPTGRAGESLRLAAHDGRTWLLTGIYFVTFGGFIALTAWFPTYWTQLFKVGIVAAGLLTAAYSVGASLLRVAGGILSDRFGGEPVLAASLAILTTGGLAMSFAGPQALHFAAIGVALLALGMGVANAAVFKLVPKFAPRSVGGSAGIVGGLGAFGGFAIPLALGAVAGALEAGYARAFLVFAALGVAGLALFWFLKKRG